MDKKYFKQFSYLISFITFVFALSLFSCSSKETPKGDEESYTKFTINMPKGWAVEKNVSKETIISATCLKNASRIIVDVSDLSELSTFDEYVVSHIDAINRLYGQNLKKSDNIVDMKINGQSAKMISYCISMPSVKNQNFICYVLNKNKVYCINGGFVGSPSSDYKSLYDQVLQSFKFE